METKLVHLPLQGGVNEKTDPLVLDPPGMPLLLNKQFSKDGALDTRYGFANVATRVVAGGSLPVPAGLTRSDGELLAVASSADAKLYGQTPTSGWVQKGTACEWYATKYWSANRVYPESAPVTQVYDVGAVGGKVVVISAIGAEVQLCIYDGTTMALQKTITSLSGLPATVISSVRLCAFQGEMVVGVQQNASNQMHVYRLNVATFAVTSFRTVTSVQTWVDIKAASDRMILAYWDGTDVYLEEYGTSWTSTGYHAEPEANDASCLTVAVGAVGEYVHAQWFDNVTNHMNLWGDIGITSTTAKLSLGGAPPALATSSWKKSTSSSVFAHSGIYAGPPTSVFSGGMQYVGATPSGLMIPLAFMYDVTVASGVFYENGSAYVAVNPSITALGFNQLVDEAYVIHDFSHFTAVDTPRVVGTLMPRETVHMPVINGRSLPPNVPQISTGVRVAGVQSQDGSIALYKLDASGAATTPRYQTTQVADTVFFNGAVPVEYDGVQPVEYGFLRAPTIAQTIAGAGNIAPGTYFYCATYAWRDGHGNIVQSPVGSLSRTGITVAAGPHKKIDVTWTSLSLALTRKYRDQGALTNPEIWIYRSEPNGLGYRLAQQIEMTPAMSGVTQTWTDDGAVGAYDGNPFLYTTGDNLEDQCPPSFTFVTAHKNRLFGADKTNLWFTKTYVANSLPGFNDVNVIPVDEGGDITGLASMDSALVVFKADRIFIVSGDGPTDTGANNDFQVSRVAAQNGCVEPRSIVVTTWGVFFKAKDGVYMLGRDMALNYIGAPMESTLSGTIVAAHYVQSQAQVAFVLSTTNVAVYDMTFQRWTTFRPMQTISAPSATTYQDNLVIGGDTGGPAATLAMLTSAASVDSDGYQNYPVRAVTKFPWIKMGGLEGFQRIRRIMLLGTVVGDGSVSVVLTYDYGQGSTQTETWTQTEITNLRVNGRIELEIQPQYQKCEAIQIEVDENYASGAGRGITWESVMLEVGIKAQRFKGLAASARK